MRKLIYIFLALFIYSCSNISVVEKKENVKIKEPVIEYEKEEKRINGDIVRVKITRLSKEKLDIRTNSFFVIDNKMYKNATIYVRNNKFILDNKEYKEIYIKNDDILSINNVKYYGDFLLKFKNGEFLLINNVNIEKYIQGVLPYEMPISFPMQALKAQAVIIRTYTYSKINNNKDYDVDDTIKYQVYKGIFEKDKEKIEKAVNDTSFEVITYDNKIIEALFHSYSGGYTASAKEVYGNYVPYLLAVEDNYSEGVNKSLLTWNEHISNNELKKKIGFIPNEFDLQYSKSNRVENISLKNNNKIKKMTGREFRQLFSLKSTAFVIQQQENGINVIGSGNGHGVGFSQWSSKTMANEYNMDYKEIIKFFYNNVQIQIKEN